MSASLRIGTFNVLFGHFDEIWGSWAARLPLIRAAVERARPDVLGLQEALTSKLDSLAGAVQPLALLPGPSSGPLRRGDLSMPYELVRRTLRSRSWRGVPLRSERMDHGEHQPIAYRPDRFRVLRSGAFWISKEPDRRGSMLALARSPFKVHWASFEPLDGTRPLIVFNAHLGHAPWHHAITARILARQMEDVAASHAERRPALLLVGDFNAIPSSTLVRRLTATREAGFVDSAAVARERIGPPGTFHWGTGSRRFALTVDYVLARASWRATRAETIELHEGRLYPSDHYPLIVEFEPG